MWSKLCSNFSFKHLSGPQLTLSLVPELNVVLLEQARDMGSER